jgi:hypothetical protein
MRRSVPAAALLGSLLVLSSGCSLAGEKHQVTFEVTGSGGPAQEIEYAVPGDLRNRVSDAPLPWTQKRTSEFGIMKVKATPSKGALTCRIVADGEEVAKVVGKDGETIECHKIVNDED